MHTTNKKMQQLHTNRTLSSSINKTNTNHIKHSIYKSPIRLPSHFLQQTNSLTDHSTNEMICIYWLFLFDSHKISKTQHFSHQLEVDTVKMGIGNYIITSEILEIFKCQTKLLESTAIYSIIRPEMRDKIGGWHIHTGHFPRTVSYEYL